MPALELLDELVACGTRAGSRRRRPTRAFFFPSLPSRLVSSLKHPGPLRGPSCPRGASTPVTVTVIRSPKRTSRPVRPPDERRLGLVQVEALAAERPRGDEALVDVAELAAEADERARVDDAGHLALEVGRRSPRSNSSRSSRNAAHTRSARRSIFIASRSRSEHHGPASRTSEGSGASSPAPTTREQRAVCDQVRVAADRRGEMRVSRAAEPGVAEVLAPCSRPA